MQRYEVYAYSSGEFAVTVNMTFSTIGEATDFIKRVEQPQPVNQAQYESRGGSYSLDTIHRHEEVKRAVLGASNHGEYKISAIKILRALTGCGLKEAKDQLEVWLREEGLCQ